MVATRGGAAGCRVIAGGAATWAAGRTDGVGAAGTDVVEGVAGGVVPLTAVASGAGLGASALAVAGAGVGFLVTPATTRAPEAGATSRPIPQAAPRMA
ncbi:MAG: hypothetical protein M3066_09250 [Actinomycetota bacterium]|nr:hypothetical protein [Actinomycetota bacterium]